MWYRPAPGDPVMRQLATASQHARQHLPPAIADLVITELRFYTTSKWLTLPPGVLRMIKELEHMDHQAKQETT